MPRTPLLAVAALVAAAAVAPPFDALADRSFAWHMLQHLVLLYLVTLLALLARPFELFAAIAGKRGTAWFVRISRPLHVLALPPVALACFVATLWATHYSGLYEASLENASAHVGEHLLYLAAGMAFWLPVLASPPLRPASFPYDCSISPSPCRRVRCWRWRSSARKLRSIRTTPPSSVLQPLPSPISAMLAPSCGSPADSSSSAHS